MTAAMSGHEKTFVAGLKTRAQSASSGAKTARPPLVTAAPINLLSVLTLAAMLGQEKAFVAVLKTPTQSASNGAKIARPSLVTAAPINLLSVLISAAVLGHEKVPEDELAWAWSARR